MPFRNLRLDLNVFITMSSQFRWISWALMLVTMMPATDLAAQKSRKNKKAPETTERPQSKDAPKKLDELTASCQAMPGLLVVHQDTVNGSTWVEIPDSILGREFIYFSYIEDGVAAAGATRGSYRGSKVIRFEKHFDRIEVKEVNTNYHFDAQSPLAKASQANLNSPILASLKIEGQNEEASVYAVSGNDLFLTENFQMIKRPDSPNRKGPLGKLSKEKTKIHSLRNYPQNLEIQVDYVYDNASPNTGGPDVVDGRFITVRYQHSLLPMPEAGFEVRRDDPRLGYFTTRIEDMTSTSQTPWLDVIHRWRLEKKDPSAAISEPVQPITWWIENTTPIEFRDIIQAGVEKWNQAFEPLGFRNAVVVKVQPDDADWDAGDIRYNVLRWTSSPNPSYSGYGPSFVNPRTGEILGADIMLEWGGMVGRLWRSEVFSEAGLVEWDSRATFAEAMHRCDAGALMAQNTLWGMTAAKLRNFTDEDAEKFTRETLHRLVLHEVGHTLGLSHNMHGSTLHTPEELKDAELIAATGLCNSVMDYPSINFPLNPEDLTQFYDDKPGFYDKWVIAYGYTPDLATPEATQDQLDAILRQSTKPELVFGNDADDMRRPGGGMNPDVNIYDLSNDPVAFAVERCELVNKLLPEITAEYADAEATDFREVRQAYLALTTEYATQLGVMTRQIGGVRYNRALPEQQTTAPLQPVSLEDQTQAMEALRQYAFAPNAFDAMTEVAGYLQDRRRGFSFFGEPEDPKIHDRVLNAQKRALDHLLHPTVLTRLVDASLYGNEYTLDAFLPSLTDAIFKADLKGSVNTFRQQLQLEYIERLMAMQDEKSRQSPWAQTMAQSELRRIEKMMVGARTAGDGLSRAHRERVSHEINRHFEAN